MLFRSYLELYGRKGLRQLAEVNTIRAHHLRSRLEGIDGISFPLAGPIFNECVIGLPDGKHEELQKRGYTIGPALGDDYPEFKDHYLMAVTEMNEPESLSELVDAARSLS